MLCKVFCASCTGMDVFTVTVEADVSDGICFYLVGLADNAIRESQQRISTALSKYGYRIPGKKIVINLAPANLKKGGSSFDLAIAISIINASRQTDLPNLQDFVILGELALDGSLRAVSGALPMIIHAKEQGFKACILPKESAFEGAEIDGIKIFGAETFGDVIEILKDPSLAQDKIITYSAIEQEETKSQQYNLDFSQVKGHTFAKKGLEIAAAGGHNVIMVGSPGSGKTLLAKCVPSILPLMSKKESIETSKIYSIAGEFNSKSGLIKKRPFRQPHHTSTIPSLTGGGTYGLPGEISLAHNGVLFLDEFAEFSRPVLEILRQPLEDRQIQISRVRTKYCYPASFMLIAAMNPCPCGYLDDDNGKCTCSTSMISRYMGKISGPLMDRIDIQLRIRPVPSSKLLDRGKEESSLIISKRVKLARDIQLERYKDEKFFSNAQIPSHLLEKYCKINQEESTYLCRIISKLGVSARGYSRILKIARTIADLDNCKQINISHITTAIQFKSMEL